MCYHAGMPTQLTIRGVPDEVGRRLARLSRDRGTSVNRTVIDLLTTGVGIDARRRRLERYVTWTAEDLAAFQQALCAQRVIDADLWR